MRRLAYIGLGAIGALALGLWAQDGPGPEGGGGGATPGGSDFSTQFNDGGALGGAGPGSSGEVLTSNGAGMAPSFQAAGGGCAPAGDEFDVLLDDGAGGCTSLGNGATATAGLPMAITPSATTIIPTVSALNNGTEANSCAVLSSSGNFSYRVGAVATNSMCQAGTTWGTGSSRRSNAQATTITYTLN